MYIPWKTRSADAANCKNEGVIESQKVGKEQLKNHNPPLLQALTKTLRKKQEIHAFLLGIGFLSKRLTAKADTGSKLSA